MRTVLPRLGAPSRRGRRLALGGSALAALTVSAVVVWHAAYATFTVSTPTYPLGWSTGAVALSDDDAGSALFTATGVEPGAADTRCIVVTSTGNVPATVRLYGTGRTSTNGLSTALSLVVVAGSGGSSSSCAGFTPSSTLYRGSFAGFPTSYAAGLDSWPTAGTAGGETRSYQLTYSMPSGAASSAQGGTLAMAFTWDEHPTAGAK
jgi:hypothetical protein